eukprot:360433-Chlamydomonas_euryale.AAC.17
MLAAHLGRGRRPPYTKGGSARLQFSSAPQNFSKALGPGPFGTCLMLAARPYTFQAHARDLLTWRGELYLELHRGTYTSHAANKVYMELYVRPRMVARAATASLRPCMVAREATASMRPCMVARGATASMRPCMGPDICFVRAFAPLTSRPCNLNAA